jgi:hypothetical protein
MVSRLGRSLTVSNVPSDPLRSSVSGGRDGDVIITDGPSAASASSFLRAEPRIGDDPERVRSGILANLIWLAGLHIQR